MKRDFWGKAILLVAFVAILVVSVYGFNGNFIKESHTESTTKADITTTSDITTTGENKTEKTSETTVENTTETTTEESETNRSELPKSTDKLVCFTFDDGPYSPVTNKILDTFEKYNGKATFFVVGSRASTYCDTIKRASELGCEIGTHTYSHVNLTKLTVDEMQKEIKKSCDEISKYSGKQVEIIRPPEGATNDTVKANIGMPMVMWSVDSLDWSYRNADKDYQSVMDNVFDGSIVLMHDLYPATAEAIARIVPDLAAQGYKFVTFSELMEIRGVDVEAGSKYFSAKPQTPSEDSAAT